MAVNGEIWTGSGTTTKKTFPEISEITYENSKNITSSDNCPPENITSCVMKVSYGNKVIKSHTSATYENADAIYKGSNHERISIRSRNNRCV